MNLARDTTLSALAAVAGTGSRLILTAMLARKLAPDAYGQFVFIQFVIELLGLLCSLGIPGILTRFLPQLSHDVNNNRRMRRGLAVLSALCVLASTCLLILYRALDPHFVQANLFVLVLWCGSTLSLTFTYAALQGLFRYDAVLAGNLAFAATAPIAAIVVAQSGSVTSAALAMIVGACASLIASVLTWKFRSAGHLSRPSSRTLAVSDLTSYGTNIWITSLIVGLVWSRGEFAVLRSFADDHAIGVYAVAITLSGLVTQGAGLFTGALTPHLVRQWSAGETAELQETLLAITSLLLIVSCACAAGLIGFGSYVISIVFGPGYAGSMEILSILAFGSIAIVSSPASLLLQIQSNARFGLWTNLTALALLILISAALTPIFATPGAAVGRALSQIVVAGITFWQLGKLAGLRRISRRLLVGWLAILGALGALALFVSQTAPSLGAAAAGVLVTLGISLWSTQRTLGITPLAMAAAKVREMLQAKVA